MASLDATRGTEFSKILSELRLLRRSPLHTMEDFARTPTILWHLGRGNVDVARAFLRHVADEIDDNHVQAAIALINPRPEDTLEDRMNEFALKVGADSTRTVRRWADEGFRILADLILDWSAEEANDQPLLEVTLAPRGPDATLVEMRASAQPGRGQMVPPRIRSSGEPLSLFDEGVDTAALGPDEYLLRTIATFPEGDETRTLQMQWLGNSNAYFAVEVLPGVMPRHSLTVTTTQRGCEVRWERVLNA